MKVKLKSQLCNIPSHIKGEEMRAYIDELECWGFKVTNNIISGVEVDEGWNPFVVLEFENADAFLKAVKERFSHVEYSGEDDLEDGMTFTLLNDPYPC